MASYNAKDKLRGLTNEELAIELKHFQNRFPGKRLLAIQLDGFSHHVVYDEGTKDSKVRSVEVSFCMSEAEELGYCRDDAARERTKAARAFLKDICHTSHSCYQGCATEIIYVEPEER